MNLGSSILLGVVALIAVGLLIALAVHFFSPESRLERRRRRSHTPIVNKSKRPMVSLRVRTKKR